MELYAALFIAFVGLSYAQSDPPLEVKFRNSGARHVSTGDRLNFVCNINRNLMYVLTNVVEIIRKSALDDSEVILTQGAKRQEAEPAFYNVSVIPGENTISVEFIIVKVRDLDEGSLICRARPFDEKPDSEKGEDKIDIVVQRPLDALYLKFDSYEAISRTTVDPIEIESGEHTVKCIAEGSNPAPTEVNLYLHGTKVGVQSETDRMEANVIKYRTTITGRIPLNVLQSNQVFECSATSRLGDKHTVGLPFKVKVYDPKIVCNNSEAHVGKRYPMLVCTVDYEGLSIKSFKYELGSRDAVQEGTQNDEFVEVERKQISDTKAIVTLNLYKAKKWHFDTEFYLVVEHTDGHSTRESVRLFETPGIEENETGTDSETGGNGSSRFSGASLVTLIISLWCAHQLFR